MTYSYLGTTPYRYQPLHGTISYLMQAVFYYEACLATFGPWRRKVQLQISVGSQYIKKSKLAPGPQDAPELTVDSLSVWNIHDDMLSPHHVEAAVRKRQSQEVTGLVVDPVEQTAFCVSSCATATNDGERSTPITRQP
jgi:hypothetical protein